MVLGLRGRVALFALMGAFLLPISTSSLRGLTHVLVCEEKVKTPFSNVLSEQGPPIVSSATRITPGEEEGLCGGLLVDLRAGRLNDKIQVRVLITNNTDSVWRGTVQMGLEGERKADFPVQIGSIRPGRTEQDVIDLSLPQGTTEIGGSLLIGP